MVAPKAVVKRYMVPNRLASLVDRPGGLSRDTAIAEATRNLERIRAESIAAIEDAIGALETLMAANAGGIESKRDELERRANTIITLGETFGLANVADAAKRLCDFTMALENEPALLAQLAAVSVKALRLLAPNGPQISEKQSARLLAELKSALDRFAPAAVPADKPA